VPWTPDQLFRGFAARDRTDLAREALQEVEDLDAYERTRILQRVEQALADELAGKGSKRDVAAIVDAILDEELGGADTEDEDEWDDEDEDDEEEDFDEEEDEDGEDDDYEDDEGDDED